MHISFKKLTFLLCSYSIVHSIAFASELETRESLKQEILKELFQSNDLKQLIAKEIKTYEIEKNKLRLQKKRQQNKNTTAKAKQFLRPVSTTSDHLYGNPKAPISIIEYSDFECPYCRKIHPVLKRLVNESDNQVNWVFRHYPLSFHKPNAQLEAEASECVTKLTDNKRFWEFIDILFAQPRRGKQGRDKLIKYAASKIDINLQHLDECIKSGQFKNKVLADEKEALKIGLRGTPANIIIHHQSKNIKIRQGSATLQTFLNDIKSLNKSTAN